MTSSCLRWAACQLNCIALFDPMQSHTLFMGILPMALYRTLLLHSIKHTLQMMSRNLIQERTKFGHVSNGVLTKSAKIYYLVSCILINCHTCLYGSQSTTYLIWSWETYLSNPWPCLLGLSFAFLTPYSCFKAIAVLMGLVLITKGTPSK